MRQLTRATVVFNPAAAPHADYYRRIIEAAATPLAITTKYAFVRALPGNPYDGHTLAAVIDATEKPHRLTAATARPIRTASSSPVRSAASSASSSANCAAVRPRSRHWPHEDVRAPRPLLPQRPRGRRRRQRHPHRCRLQPPSLSHLAEQSAGLHPAGPMPSPHRHARAQMDCSRRQFETGRAIRWSRPTSRVCLLGSLAAAQAAIRPERTMRLRLGEMYRLNR